MNNEKLIKKTSEYVRHVMKGESSGHDWWHAYRVWQMARRIGKKEKADRLRVELAALLHDIADYKLHGGDVEIGPRKAEEWLRSLGVDQKIINHIKEIIRDASFKGSKVKSEMKTLEGKIVQDADRLDAIGAIGIARTFAYGGHKGAAIHDPRIKPIMYESFEEYKSNTPPTINHFYEKLLLLKDLMNTKTAKKIAEGRHKFMENYLSQFYKEWEGKV
jgi:uncharacterized protein